MGCSHVFSMNKVWKYDEQAEIQKAIELSKQEAELQKAIEESKKTAEREEKERK